MNYFADYKNRKIRLSNERKNHFEENHPELVNQEMKIEETLSSPDCIINSNTDTSVELFYKYYKSTPVGAMYLCVVAKFIGGNDFIVTAYFTDVIKKGELLWKKK